MRIAIAPTPKTILWTEFVALFLGAPLAMAVFFGAYSLFGVIWALTGVALILLAVTPGFRWRTLLRGPVLGEWKLILAFTVATALVSSAFVMALIPNAFLAFPWYRTGFWLLVMIAYPIASALPQEIIFRTLFFERYGALFPTDAARIGANGALFGFGHLFYMNPVTILMTAFGGALMGWAYLRNRSVLLAWALHAIGGQIVFTVGLGRYFYHGAVG